MEETSQNSRNVRFTWEERKAVIINPANKYMLKIDNVNTIKTREIYSMLKQRHQNDIHDVVLLFLLLNLNLYYTFF